MRLFNCRLNVIIWFNHLTGNAFQAAASAYVKHLQRSRLYIPPSHCKFMPSSMCHCHVRKRFWLYLLPLPHYKRFGKCKIIYFYLLALSLQKYNPSLSKRSWSETPFNPDNTQRASLHSLQIHHIFPVAWRSEIRRIVQMWPGSYWCNMTSHQLSLSATPFASLLRIVVRHYHGMIVNRLSCSWNPLCPYIKSEREGKSSKVITGKAKIWEPIRELINSEMKILTSEDICKCLI